MATGEQDGGSNMNVLYCTLSTLQAIQDPFLLMCLDWSATGMAV